MFILWTFYAAQHKSFKPKFKLKGIEIELFLQKNEKNFLRFFSETPVRSHKF